MASIAGSRAASSAFVESHAVKKLRTPRRKAPLLPQEIRLSGFL
jgi:hypothetical protein